MLHEFGQADGYDPIGLRRDSAGNLYGVAASGGANGCGLVYELTAGGKFTTLHTFSGKDGCHPSGALIGDGVGNFYGTTEFGGIHCGQSGCGVLFKLAQDGTCTALHDFTGGDEGKFPGVWLAMMLETSTAPRCTVADTGVAHSPAGYSTSSPQAEPSLSCMISPAGPTAVTRAAWSASTRVSFMAVQLSAAGQVVAVMAAEPYLKSRGVAA